MNLHLTITTATGATNTQSARNTTANRIEFIDRARELAELVDKGQLKRVKVWYERRGNAYVEFDTNH